MVELGGVKGEESMELAEYKRAEGTQSKWSEWEGLETYIGKVEK